MLWKSRVTQPKFLACYSRITLSHATQSESLLAAVHVTSRGGERADDLDAFFKEIDEESEYDWVDLPSGSYVL